MADSTPGSEPENGTPDVAARDPAHLSTTGTPRWVKVFVIIAVVLALLIVVMLLTGIGGEHGPARHVSFGSAPLVGLEIERP